MTYIVGSLLIVAGFTWAAWLVHRSDQLAATARQADPDRTDYQARLEADQKAGK